MEENNRDAESNESRRKAGTRKTSAKERHQRRFSSSFFLTLALTLVVTALVSLALSPLMNIETVEVSGNKVVSTEKILKMAKNPVGINTFVFNKQDAIQSIEAHPYVESVKIKRELPNALYIKIKERRPVGVLVNKGVYLQFSDGGLLLNNTNTLSSFNLPIITGMSLQSVPQPGGAIKDPTFKQALAIVNAMSDDLLKSIQEVNIAEPENILAYTYNGIEIRIGDAKNIKARMAVLDDIMDQVVLTKTVKGDIDYIDIRYLKAPVLKMKGGAAPSEMKEEDDGMQPSAQEEAQTVVGTTEAAVQTTPIPEEQQGAMQQPQANDTETEQ